MNSRLILGFGCSLLFTAAAFGQNWINPAGGSWGVPGNWSNDGTPFSPVFDLNAAAPGYTTSLSQSYIFANGFSVQSDNVTVDLNGFGFGTSILTVAATTGQTGSLALVGPGTISVFNVQTSAAGIVDVGDQGGTGQLTVNDATILLSGEGGGHFDANGLMVENGGQIKLNTSGNYTVTDATFSNGSFAMDAGISLYLNQISMTNGSNIGGLTITIGNATLDNSTIDASGSGTVEGTVTLSNNAQLEIPDETLSGTLYLSAGTKNGAGGLTMQNGTISVELNGQISDPVFRPLSQDNGTLDFTLQSGFEPTIGEQFAVLGLSNPNATGTFAAVNLPALPAGELWNISNLYSTGTISVVPEPISMGMMLLGAAGLALRHRRKPAHDLRQT